MYRKIFIFLLIYTLIGCSSVEKKEDKFTKENIHKFNVASYLKDNEFDLINEAEYITESASHIKFALSFTPSLHFRDKIKILDNEDFEFINVNNNSFITGTYTVNNATDREIDITLLFLQGNKSAPINISDADIVPAINFTANSNSSFEIPIELKWENDGDDELIIFPIIHDSDFIRYDGKNFGIARMFVKNEEFSILKKDIENQAFSLPDDFDPNTINFIPSLNWIDGSFSEITYREKDNRPYTLTKIKGLQLPPLPYNTDYDFLLIDEYGNTKILKESILVEQNKIKNIIFDDELLEDIYSHNHRQFIIMLNNRGNNMIADIKALDLAQKPFITSFSGVIEVPVFRDNENN